MTSLSSPLTSRPPFSPSTFLLSSSGDRGSDCAAALSANQRATGSGGVAREEEGEESGGGRRSCDLEEEGPETKCRGEGGDKGKFFRVGGAGDAAPEGVGGAQQEVGGAACNDSETERSSSGDKNDSSNGEITVYVPCDQDDNAASHDETTETQAERRPLRFTPRVPSMDKCPLPPENDICLLVNKINRNHIPAPQFLHFRAPLNLDRYAVTFLTSVSGKEIENSQVSNCAPSISLRF